MITIHDVAKESGVSISTVSRVLNNSLLVSDDKCARVMEAVQRLGYKHESRKSTAKNHPKLILVLTSIIKEDLFESIEHEAASRGCQVVYRFTGYNNDSFESCLNFIDQHLLNNVTGIILNNIIYNKVQVEQIAERVPLVQVLKCLDYPNNHSIATDDSKASYEMLNYLVDKGCRRIALVNFANKGEDKEATYYEQEREAAYYRVLRENQLEQQEGFIIHTSPTIESSYDAVKSLLTEPVIPDAFFCTNDHLAAGCIKAIKDSGYRIPEDISVTGFDNESICTIVDPSITTISPAYAVIGQEAVKMLIQMIESGDKTGRRLLINHDIIIRDSTK